ncbi:hypothetical protein EV146_104118 [Mesobacillus foraminis]|uniref:Uncharacterized protein n=1 Tax=Mesobacillus foraminis TaxID=279826 RepID=A0A4R2BGA9_9BACI|nr:hypothetical protein EV146_104118 [Mesobacillus foraminis]
MKRDGCPFHVLIITRKYEKIMTKVLKLFKHMLAKIEIKW